VNVRREGEAFVAEENGSVLGTARPTDEGVTLELKAPREGVALALLRAVAAASGDAGASGSETVAFGSIHLQTDNQDEAVGVVRRIVPRVFPSPVSIVAPPRNGWIAVYDLMAESDAKRLRRLGQELSASTGLVTFAIGVEGPVVHYTAFERGRVMDEYDSVPGYREPLPPGDAIALRANPTVVARLTGASAAAVRAAALSAGSPDELPPAEELIRQIAEVIGLEGTQYRLEEARNVPGAVVVEHG
jgi:hypothetical protein